MCTACTQILPGQGCPPINHSWHQKTRDTTLPDGKVHIPVRSLVLTQCQSATDRFAVAHTVLAKLALWRAEKTKQ